MTAGRAGRTVAKVPVVSQSCGERAGGFGWRLACEGIEYEDGKGRREDFAPCGEAGGRAVPVFREYGESVFEGRGVENGEAVGRGGGGGVCCESAVQFLFRGSGEGEEENAVGGGAGSREGGVLFVSVGYGWMKVG